MIESHSSIEPEYRQIERLVGYRFGGDGSVWSCWKRGSNSLPSGKWRKLALARVSRYMAVGLRVDSGSRVMFYVHRLICEAFHGPCPEGMECLHWDDIPDNNRPGNLRWGTREQNVADSMRNGGMFVCPRGSAHANSKVTEDDVLVIRQLAKDGISYPKIAARYGLAVSSVCLIVRRKTWAHVA